MVSALAKQDVRITQDTATTAIENNFIPSLLAPPMSMPVGPLVSLTPEQGRLLWEKIKRMFGSVPNISEEMLRGMAVPQAVYEEWVKKEPLPGMEAIPESLKYPKIFVTPIEEGGLSVLITPIETETKPKILIPPLPERAKPQILSTPLDSPRTPMVLMKNSEETKEWTTKARLKAAKLPTEGKIRFVTRKGYHASEPLKKGDNHSYLDKFKNEWIKGPSRTAGQPFEWDVQLSSLGKEKLGWASRDGKHINVSLDGKITHK